jgi:hypothetical protein
MKPTYYIIIGITIFFLAVGVFIGWHLKPSNDNTSATATINFDSLHTVWAEGLPSMISVDSLLKVDSTFRRLLAQKKYLRDTLRDTAWIPSTELPLPDAIFYSMDTCVTDSATIIINNNNVIETRRVWNNITLGVDFLNQPYNVFRLRKLNRSSLRLNIYTEEKIIHQLPFFNLNAILGSNSEGRVGAGGSIQLYNYGVGALYQHQESPFYYGIYRVGF